MRYERATAYVEPKSGQVVLRDAYSFLENNEAQFLFSLMVIPDRGMFFRDQIQWYGKMGVMIGQA